MTTTPRTSSRRRNVLGSLLWLAVFALIAAACSSSTVTTESITADTSTADTSTTVDEPATETEPEPEEEPEPEPEEEAEPEPEPEPEEEPEPEPELATDDGPAQPGDASVVVLDTGAEPRVELRINPASSCSELLTVLTVQEIEQTIAGEALPSAGAIGNVIEMETTVTPNGENFDVRNVIISSMAAPDTPPALAAQLNPELANLIGITSGVTVTDRALQVPGSSFVEGAEVLGQFASTVESLNQTQAPLPLEAVGLGAQWETRSTIEVEGLIVTTITLNELTAIDGTIIELTATATQEVDPTSRMEIQGLTGEVLVWDVTSTGSTVIDLATITPLSSRAVSEGVQEFDFGFAGELQQELRTEITAEAIPNEGCTGRTIRG